MNPDSLDFSQYDFDAMTTEEIDALFAQFFLDGFMISEDDLPPDLMFDPVTGEIVSDPDFGDEFYNTGGDDIFDGTMDDDIFYCGLGDDAINGGDGWDEVDYTDADFAIAINLLLGVITGNGQDQISNIEHFLGTLFGDDFLGDLNDNSFDGGDGDDFADGGDGNDDLFGGDGNDDLEGGFGDDYLDGGTGADELLGGVDDDDLSGEAGKDVLNGGSGNDLLSGGAGCDRMTGGAGNDVFDFNLANESGRGALRDTITDFRHLFDDINLRDIDANTRIGGNQNFKFIGFQDFHGRAGELHLTKVANGLVIAGDINGDSKADFEIMVVKAAISSADLIL